MGRGKKRGGRTTFIDLFAGVGGFRVALEGQGLKCTFASETDRNARLVYDENFGGWPFGDLREIQSGLIPDHDVLCAGFPCQPFSVATSGRKGLRTKRGLAHPDGRLFNEIVRVMRDKRPKAAILENVPRLLTMRGGSIWGEMREAMSDAGYHMPHCVLNASDFGVPQARKRLYAVCLPAGSAVADAWRPPVPPLTPVRLADVMESDADIDKDLLERLIVRHPALQIREGVDETPRNATIRVGEILSRKDGKVSHSQRVFSTQGHAPTQTVGKGSRSSSCMYLRNAAGQGSRVYSTEGHSVTQSAHGGGWGANTGLYHIVPNSLPRPKIGQGRTVFSTRGHAVTQVRSTGGGQGGLYLRDRFYLREPYVRCLTAREVARVMGFPDSFGFCDLGDRQVKELLGNAVVPQVVAAVWLSVQEAHKRAGKPGLMRDTLV